MATPAPAASRLSALRKHLKAQKLDGVFVPRTDAFMGEYVPTSDERLRWVTGFSGSAGFALIGLTHAVLVVDGRYTLQAPKETKGSNIKILSLDAAELAQFLGSFRKGSNLGFDPWVTSMAEARRLTKAVEAAGHRLVATTGNLVDAVWAERPRPPANPVVVHPLRLAGQTVDEKLTLLAKVLRDKNCGAVVLTDAHSVAWAFNIRGSDITHTPLALLRAIVFKDGTAQVFVEKDRCPAGGLGKSVKLVDPALFAKTLAGLPGKHWPVMLDASQCPDAIRAILAKSKITILEDVDPCSLPRARKNTTEQAGSRRAHLRDAAAVANFLAWLDGATADGSLTEIAAQEKLHGFRKVTGKLKDLSFGTISAAGANAALPHYHSVGKTGARLKRDQIYLIDSGGQYEDGTTDITRTLIIGSPTTEMKRHNTLVLKGMIAVSMARFPVGTTGIQIDALARAALWQQGFDFDHGTGHGVGSYLSVHEGPARISKAGHVALEPGMILSNEPGYYKPGRYGIRIENLLLVTPATKVKGGERAMLGFETLSFAPIDKRLIDESLLTKAEIHWLDDYHAEVLRKIGGGVLPETRAWLEKACAPLTKRT
jgi:Xaa-Pro aminopeptidase